MNNLTQSILKPSKLTLLDHNYVKSNSNVNINNNNSSNTISTEITSESSKSKRSLMELDKGLEVMESETTVTCNNLDENTSTLDDFTTVENRRRKVPRQQVSTENRYKTTLSNRFEPLANDDVCDENDVSSRPVRVPPVFLHDANNYQALVHDLNLILKSEYFTENKGKSIKINTSTPEDFRALTSHFDKINVQYHSFCPPDSKQLSVVMRNIPVSLTDEEILTELKHQNYPAYKVTRLYNKDKQPIPICTIDLENSDTGTEIFGLEFMFHSKIKIEPKRKPKSIPQCTRCQRYGHTKNYCKLNPRCVKCTGDHHFSQCSIKKGIDNVSCVNCGAGHTANFKGCPYYLNLKSRTNQTKSNESVEKSVNFNLPSDSTHFPVLAQTEESTKQPKLTNNLPPRNTTTYANATRGNRSTHQSSQNNETTTNTTSESEHGIFHSLLNSLLSCIKKYIPQIKTFISEMFKSILINGS
jgi:hypothetical protein